MKKFFYKLTLPLRGFGLSSNLLMAPLVNRINLYFTSNNPESVVIKGSTFYIDPIDSLHLMMGSYEPGITVLLKKYITPDSVVLDIGANIGYHTIFAAQWGKQVIAFEAEQRNFDLLQKNIAANYCANVTAVHAAVSDTPGTVNLFIAEDNRGGHSMVHGDKKTLGLVTRPTIAVPAVVVDEYLKGARVDVIKMDIEGAEGLALKGMLATIAKWRPVVITEFRAASLRFSGVDPDWFLNFFADLGYVRKEIGHPKDEGELTFRNYVFIPAA